MSERPDGSTATIIGWILVTAGVLSSFFVISAESPAGFWFSIGFANLGIGLGVLLLSLGYLVQAIWFLPGREIEKADAELQIARHCTYCDKSIQPPAIPCSAVSRDELPDVAHRIDDDDCVQILRDKGLLST